MTGGTGRRVALVTGSGRGIGRAIALGLAHDGFDVVVNYRRDEQAAQAVVAEVERCGCRATAFRASVDDAAAARDLARHVLDAHGGLDLLVCNAGVASSGRAVADASEREVERILGSHAVSAHHLCRLLLPALRERAGSIVLVSSTATRNPVLNGAPYNMAKAAMEALAASLVQEELPHRVRVNVVAPGLVDTEMGRRLVGATIGVGDIRALDAASPLGRVCSPDDVAGVVRFLASPLAGYVNGQRIYVDGGGTGAPPPVTDTPAP